MKSRGYIDRMKTETTKKTSSEEILLRLFRIAEILAKYYLKEVKDTASNSVIASTESHNVLTQTQNDDSTLK
jgi:hypothetical protein